MPRLMYCSTGKDEKDVWAVALPRNELNQELALIIAVIHLKTWHFWGVLQVDKLQVKKRVETMRWCIKENDEGAEMNIGCNKGND